jgi:hypothetical protein
VHRIAAKRPSAPSRQTSPNRFHVMSHFEAIKQIRKSYAPWLPRDHAMFKRGDNGCRLCSIVFGHVSLPSYCCAPLRAAFGTPYDRDKESERAVERSRALIALAARSAAAVTKKNAAGRFLCVPCQRRPHRAHSRLARNTRGHHENRLSYLVHLSWKNEPRLNDLVSRFYDQLQHSVRQGDMSDLSEGD